MARILPGNLFSRIGVHRLELSPLDTVRKRVVVCDARLLFFAIVVVAASVCLPAHMATPMTEDLTLYGRRTSGDENRAARRLQLAPSPSQGPSAFLETGLIDLIGLVRVPF